MRADLDLSYFEERLKGRLGSLAAVDQSRKESAAVVELDQARMGRLSRMDALQQQAMSQATSRLSDVESRRIKAALERIRSGEYGYCVICGEEIAEARLRFDPSVPNCIVCAEKSESL
jgi:DnaK suppressor protein